MDFQQSKTFLNLQSAFETELIIATKFLIYAIKARQDGFMQIGNTYDQIAGFDREFATVWLKLLNGGQVPDTLSNLIDSYTITNEQAMQRYQEYSRVALEEGYTSIASLFNGVANIQMNHENKFRELATDVENDTVFCKGSQVLWICLNCGNILSGDCAPSICPVCGFPQGYYQIYIPECP